MSKFVICLPAPQAKSIWFITFFLCFSLTAKEVNKSTAKEVNKSTKVSTKARAKQNKPLSSQTTSTKNTLSQLMTKILKKQALPNHYIGGIMGDFTQTLYQINADKLFIPASLIKIWTAGALLELLSPSQTFTTQFMATNPIKNATLNSPLYLKGGGDSSFVSESLWNLINNLTRTGLKTVKGDLIVDDSYFDSKTRGPRLNSPSHLSYDAPISALSFNWNTVNIYLRPGNKINQALKITIDPSPLYFSNIDNQTKTTHSKSKKKLFVQRKALIKHKESLIIKGQMPLGHKEVLIYKNVLYPALWTGWNALAFLKQRGIDIQGSVQLGKTPKKAFVLSKWTSRPLTEQVQLMMKYSNNFMVEMLVKNLALTLNPLRTKNRLDHLQEGLKIIQTYLQKQGISKTEYTLVQPSGLSQQNKIKPLHLMQFLKYWASHPLQPEFESTFPLANEDGTLKKYFQTDIFKGRLRAKTGSLNGVIGLAGYLTTQKGEKRIFVFIFNGPSNLKKKAQSLFQTWLTILFRHS